VLGFDNSRFLFVAAASFICSVLIAPSLLSGADQPTLEELKARVGNAAIGDRPPLCIHVSDLQLGAAGRFYTAGDSEQAKTSLTDVVAFSELARDYAVQSHKHEKQSEIAIRKMVRKLGDLKHTVSHDDQAQIESTIKRLERVRDDLLAAMFPKGSNK